VAGDYRLWGRSKRHHRAHRSRGEVGRSDRDRPATNQVEPIGIFGALVGVVAIANMWMAFALSVKRLHDRDRTGWWLVWQLLILCLAVFLVVVAVAVPREQGAVWYALADAAGFAAFVISVWLFVQIGFLRGTGGPNRFGPDPLGAMTSDAKL
jgi:uncharacterized membrane protein YhaH (DUF805 family)